MNIINYFFKNNSKHPTACDIREYTSGNYVNVYITERKNIQNIITEQRLYYKFILNKDSKTLDILIETYNKNKDEIEFESAMHCDYIQFNDMYHGSHEGKFELIFDATKFNVHFFIWLQEQQVDEEFYNDMLELCGITRDYVHHIKAE